MVNCIGHIMLLVSLMKYIESPCFPLFYYMHPLLVPEHVKSMQTSPKIKAEFYIDIKKIEIRDWGKGLEF